MAIKHRDVFYDYVDRCYNCRFCGKWWGYDEPEPDCMTGHEKNHIVVGFSKGQNK